MRLIDASTLIDNIVDKWARSEASCGRYIDTTVKAVRDGEISTVTKQPTIDAVEVVRCKDCKHSPVGKSNGSEPDTRCPLWCGYCYNIGDEGDDFFCKYGDRREG